MHIPSSFRDLIQEPFGIEPVADHGLIYPPVGFQPWPIGELGNGDEYGYYWPIGKEATEPIVAMTSHDCWALIPVASSIEALARIGGCPQVSALVSGVPEEANADDLDDKTPSLTIAEQLELDPDSPHLLVANADMAMANNDLEQSESLYFRAIELLPEYTAAHYGLAMLYRRQRKLESAVRWMLEAIRSPMSFQGASFWAHTSLPFNRSDFRRKCLTWLQRTKPDDVPGVADDPLFQICDRLTFATGVKTIDDFALYESVIGEYASRGMILEAIRLLTLFGELMMCETVSFRERNDFTERKFRDWLLSLFRLGPVERVEFLGAVV